MVSVIPVVLVVAVLVGAFGGAAWGHLGEENYREADSEAAAQVIERTDGEYRSLLVTLSLRGGDAESDDIVPVLAEHAATMEGDGRRSATVAGRLAVDAAVLDRIVGGILTTTAVALVTSFLVSVLVLPSALALWSRHAPVDLRTDTASGDPLPQD